MPLTDESTREVTEFLATQYPDIRRIEFCDDHKGDTPRAVCIANSTQRLELLELDRALFRHFHGR